MSDMSLMVYLGFIALFFIVIFIWLAVGNRNDTRRADEAWKRYQAESDVFYRYLTKNRRPKNENSTPPT